MTRFLIALFALYFACLASGCGQSGPLYIPGDPSRIETSPPPPQEQENGEEQDENDDDTDKQ